MKYSECESQLPGMIVCVRLHVDPARTVMIGHKRAPRIEMIQQSRDKGFVVFWHAEHVGWVILWKKSAEQTIEFACSYKSDIADLNRPIWVPWTWLPQCVSVRRIFYGKPFAEDIVLCHRRPQLEESRELSMPLGVRPVGLGKGYWTRRGCDTRISPRAQISESVFKTCPTIHRLVHPE